MVAKKKIKCPECETESEIDISATGDDGCCPKCGLDVATVYRRVRHEQAVKKVLAEQEPKEPKKKEPTTWW